MVTDTLEDGLLWVVVPSRGFRRTNRSRPGSLTAMYCPVFDLIPLPFNRSPLDLSNGGGKIVRQDLTGYFLANCNIYVTAYS